MNIHTQSFDLMNIASQNFIPYQNTLIARRGMQTKDTIRNKDCISVIMEENDPSENRIINAEPLMKRIPHVNNAITKKKEYTAPLITYTPLKQKKERSRSRSLISSKLPMSLQSKLMPKRKIIEQKQYMWNKRKTIVNKR